MTKLFSFEILFSLIVISFLVGMNSMPRYPWITFAITQQPANVTQSSSTLQVNTQQSVFGNVNTSSNTNRFNIPPNVNPFPNLPSPSSSSPSASQNQYPYSYTYPYQNQKYPFPNLPSPSSSSPSASQNQYPYSYTYPYQNQKYPYLYPYTYGYHNQSSLQGTLQNPTQYQSQYPYSYYPYQQGQQQQQQAQQPTQSQASFPSFLPNQKQPSVVNSTTGQYNNGRYPNSSQYPSQYQLSPQQLLGATGNTSSGSYSNQPLSSQQQQQVQSLPTLIVVTHVNSTGTVGQSGNNPTVTIGENGNASAAANFTHIVENQYTNPDGYTYAFHYIRGSTVGVLDLQPGVFSIWQGEQQKGLQRLSSNNNIIPLSEKPSVTYSGNCITVKSNTGNVHGYGTIKLGETKTCIVTLSFHMK